MQQVKVQGVEKKKKVARQRRKEGLAGGWREKEREGEGAEAEQNAAAAPDCLAVVNGWMDRSHFSDENTASESVIEFQPWSPQTVGRLVWTTSHESKVLCRGNERAREGKTPRR